MKDIVCYYPNSHEINKIDSEADNYLKICRRYKLCCKCLTRWFAQNVQSFNRKLEITDNGVVFNFGSSAPFKYKKNIVEGTVHNNFRSISTW